MSLPDFISIVPVQTIVSPCVSICRIGRDKQCKGCRRSLDEIARWTNMTASERDAVMADLLGR